MVRKKMNWEEIDNIGVGENLKKILVFQLCVRSFCIYGIRLGVFKEECRGKNFLEIKNMIVKKQNSWKSRR